MSRTPQSTRRVVLGAGGASALAGILAACGGGDPLAGDGTGQDDAGQGGGAGASDGGGDGTIVVGSQAYYSNEIIAELYAQVLEAAGATVQREYQIGQREVYIAELESGNVDLIPEYSGALLQYYDAESDARTLEEITTALPEALPEGLRVLEAAEASDQDSYTTTRAFAEKHSLTSIGDLTNAPQPVKVGANSEFASRPYGVDGVKETYGVEITHVPIEDSGGPLTVRALKDGDVDVADIYTADPSIAANDFVTLEDPQSMILPQNVVPLATDAVDESAAEQIAKINEKLTTDELIALNTRSVDEQLQSAQIAKEWLTEQGLL